MKFILSNDKQKSQSYYDRRIYTTGRFLVCACNIRAASSYFYKDVEIAELDPFRVVAIGNYHLTALFLAQNLLSNGIFAETGRDLRFRWLTEKEERNIMKKRKKK